MTPELIIDVAGLDHARRRVLEEVVGRKLSEGERLAINIIEAAPANKRRPQTMADWAKVYRGLSDAEVASLDAIANSRANLTRELPQP